MADLFKTLVLPVTTPTETLVAGTVDFYNPGTTGASNRKDVYTDAAATTVAANPYTLDANATATLYGVGLYHIVIKNSSGVVVYDYDYITPDQVFIVYNPLSLADLQTFAGYDGAVANLIYRTTIGDQGGGTFYWDSSDLSTEVAADTLTGIYVAAAGGDGSTGAWVRRVDILPTASHFGITGTGDETAAIQAMLDFLFNTTNYLAVYFYQGTYTATSLTNPGIQLIGDGAAFAGGATDAIMNWEDIVRSAGGTVTISDPTVLDGVVTLNADMTVASGKFLRFSNNTNTLLQKDQFGSYQNIAYYDADTDLVIGPNDPRISVLTTVPVNLFRQHIHSPFDENGTLDTRWAGAATGSGTIVIGSSDATLRTGAIGAGDGYEITGPEIDVPFLAGQRLFFYLSTPTSGDLSLEFGWKDGTGRVVNFTRSEVGVAQNYFANTSNGGTTTSTDTTQGGDSVRRIFCIDVVSTSQVDFYIGTDAGVLILLATNTTDIPTAGVVGFPYVKINSNGSAVNREVSVDDVYLILVK